MATTKRKPRETPQIAPGYVVINISGATGGVSYTREIVATRAKKAARATTFMNVMRVDHAGYVEQINALVKKVDDTVLRSLCVKTSFGHFVSEGNIEALRREVADLRRKVEALNAAAAVAGSQHRGRIGVVAPRLDVDQPEVVTECSRTVIEVLSAVRDVLRLGDVDDVVEGGIVVRRNQLKPLLLRAKNIETIAIGPAGAALAAALDRVRAARGEIRAGAPAATVSLTAIDRAITWFV
jgi:hypothetical protein